jgi:hypothetical protein
MATVSDGKSQSINCVYPRDCNWLMATCKSLKVQSKIILRSASKKVPYQRTCEQSDSSPFTYVHELRRLALFGFDFIGYSHTSRHFEWDRWGSNTCCSTPIRPYLWRHIHAMWAWTADPDSPLRVYYISRWVAQSVYGKLRARYFGVSTPRPRAWYLEQPLTFCTFSKVIKFTLVNQYCYWFLFLFIPYYW